MSPAERWRATVVAVAGPGTPAAAAAPGQLQLPLALRHSWRNGPPPAPVCTSPWPPPRPRRESRGPRFDRVREWYLRRRGEVPPLAAGYAEYRGDLMLARAQLRDELAYIAAHALDSWSDQ